MLITQYDYKVSSPTKYSNFYYEFNLVKEICQKKILKPNQKFYGVVVNMKRPAQAIFASKSWLAPLFSLLLSK